MLVVRGAGEDLGSGADLPEDMDGAELAKQPTPRLAEYRLGDDGSQISARGSFRRGATLGQWYANPQSGYRGLQDFKKISILEAKGYCYGWHFYQAADADLVISSDDALFGHPSFRYYGWGPRMWWWAQTMGIRKFQEMVFTGRPFTAAEMYECNFLNSVVPRDELEAEVEKYALACARNRPTDTVFMQKIFFEIMKQFQGEYMGSMLSGFFESMGGGVRPDGNDDFMLDSIFDGAIEQSLGDAVKDNDGKFPPGVAAEQDGAQERAHQEGARSKAKALVAEPAVDRRWPAIRWSTYPPG